METEPLCYVMPDLERHRNDMGSIIFPLNLDPLQCVAFIMSSCTIQQLSMGSKQYKWKVWNYIHWLTQINVYIA